MTQKVLSMNLVILMKSSDEENSGNVLITINLNVDVVNSLKIQKKKYIRMFHCDDQLIVCCVVSVFKSLIKSSVTQKMRLSQGALG